MLVATSTEDTSNLCTICLLCITDTTVLYVAHHSGHMTLGKKCCRSCNGTTHATGSKVVAVSNTINNNHLKKRVYFPSSSFVAQIADTQSPVQFGITINSPINTVLVISEGEHHTRLVLSLTILTLPTVIF